MERRAADRTESDSDAVAVEAPLEIRANGTPQLVVMRTPGDDVELAVGLLYAEGVLSAAELDLVAPAAPASLAASERGNVVEVALPAEEVAARWPTRTLYASSACGVCGKTSMANLATRAAPVREEPRIPAGVIAGLPATLLRSQAGFGITGGVHAAGAFSHSGELLAIREDVGRHNAVDKLVGWGLRGGVRFADLILCVSGRLSFEIVQKAVVAGIPVVVAVSAPSSLAIDLAEQFRVTLCGFTRDGRFNLYTHSTRVEARW